MPEKLYESPLVVTTKLSVVGMPVDATSTASGPAGIQ